METTKKNWYKEYLTNESISGNVSNIIGTYSRMSSNNPNNKDYVAWQKEIDKWLDYKKTLPFLVIDTEKEALVLKNKISEELNKVYEIEKKQVAKATKKKQ